MSIRRSPGFGGSGFTGQVGPVEVQQEPPRWIRHTVPWVLAGALLGVGAGLHAVWGQGPALPWITAALTPVMCLLTGLAWHLTGNAGRRMGPSSRLHVAGTVAAVCAWLLLALVLGPWMRGVIDAWALGGTALAVSWNLRLALYRPSRRDDDGGDDDGRQMTPHKAGKAFMAAIGMGGDEIRADEVNEFRVGGQLALTSGKHTADEVQKRGPQIATALGIPKSGVRIVENPEDASRPEFSFTVRDVLGGVLPWKGPTAVGGTVFAPIPMGVYETGRVMVKRLADGSGAKHEIQQGVSGSGKSSGAKVELCEVMTRRETAIVVIDTVKGLQTFGPAAPGLALFLVDAKKALAFLKRMMHVIRGRGSYLGARGLSEWAPGCGLSFLVVQIEEASDLFKHVGDDAVEAIAKAARSVGISLKVSLQRPSHDEMSTTTRAQLGTVSCYGLAADDQVCMLPDAVLDAGADPWQWADRQPGCCYVAGPGITVGSAATPLRTYSVSMQQLADHAAEWGPQMDPLDPITAGLLGELWARREIPADLVARMTAQALRDEPRPTVVDGSVVDEDAAGWDDERIEYANADDLDDLDDLDDDQGQDEDDEFDEWDPEEIAVTEEDMGITDHDPDEEIADIDDQAEEVDNIVFREPGERAPVEEARATVDGRLSEIEEQGRDTVRVPDFADLYAESVSLRSRAWFRKELQRLEEVGRLVDEGEGVWRIVPRDELEPDALDELDSDRDDEDRDDEDQDGQGAAA